MRTGLRKARWRDTQQPWHSYTKAAALGAQPEDLADSVHLVATYDEDQQTLILTVARYDLTEGTFEPCFTELVVREVGPFGAVGELLDVASTWAGAVIEAYGLPDPLEQCLRVVADTEPL